MCNDFKDFFPIKISNISVTWEKADKQTLFISCLSSMNLQVLTSCSSGTNKPKIISVCGLMPLSRDDFRVFLGELFYNENLAEGSVQNMSKL